MRSAAYREVVLRDRPLTFFMMGEGGVAEWDLAGRGATRTLTNSPTKALAGPGFTNAMGFTAGSTQYSLISGGGVSALADVATFEAWCRRRSTAGGVGSEQGILTKGQNAGSSGLYLRWGTTNTLELLKSQSSVLVTGTRAVTDTTTFHHVVGTKNGSDVHLYLDAQDVTGTVTNATCAAGYADLRVNVELGTSLAEYGTQDLAGVAAYNYALSRAQVLAHYVAGRGVVQPYKRRI